MRNFVELTLNLDNLRTPFSIVKLSTIPVESECFSIFELDGVDGHYAVNCLKIDVNTWKRNLLERAFDRACSMKHLADCHYQKVNSILEKFRP